MNSTETSSIPQNDKTSSLKIGTLTPEQELDPQILATLIPKPTFEYTWSMYHQRSSATYQRPVVQSVEFDVSRYGDVSKTIEFDEPVSVSYAVLTVERYLSLPLSQEYYDEIKEDLFDDEMDWEDAQKEYENRGACLTDCRFLEQAKLVGTKLTLSCGS